MKRLIDRAREKLENEKIKKKMKEKKREKVSEKGENVSNQREREDREKGPNRREVDR